MVDACCDKLGMYSFNLKHTNNEKIVKKLKRPTKTKKLLKLEVIFVLLYILYIIAGIFNYVHSYIDTTELNI